MAAYRLFIRPAVHKDVRDVPKAVLLRIRTAIKGLADDPFARGVAKLQGSENTYRIRIGNYRIIFEVNSAEKRVDIVHVAHRRDVYRKY